MEIKVRQPQNPVEFNQYYKIRRNILRTPWEKPLGSELDSLEDEAVHAMAFAGHSPAGVARMHFIDPEIAQIRYMAVLPEFRGNNIGTHLLNYLEEQAIENKVKEIILHARENALEFYLKNNYENLGKSYIMWGSIQHFKMLKKL